ncbi:ROK family protein [Jatrophihabitans fulvus]
MNAVVALDVGGTGMKGWVCDAGGRELARLARPTPAAEGPGAVVAAVRAAVVDLARQATADAVGVAAVGVVVPGVVDVPRGVAVWSANLAWRDVPLRELIEADTGVPVALDHDVRAGGAAEARLGAGRGVASSLFVPVGTGIAGALVLDGAAWPGAIGASGEVGHLVVHPGGEPCACGQHGCVETYASAAAIARRYTQRTGRTTTSAELVGRLSGDPDARAVWDEAVEALARGLAAATTLLDPARIVVGGGLASAGEALLAPLRERLAAQLAWRAAPDLVAAQLGDAAGRHGAALLAWAAAGVPDVAAGWRIGA